MYIQHFAFSYYQAHLLFLSGFSIHRRLYFRFMFAMVWRTCLWSSANNFKYLDGALSTAVVVYSTYFCSVDYLICMIRSNWHTHSHPFESFSSNVQFVCYIHLNCIMSINVAFNGFNCVYLHGRWNAYGQSSATKESKTFQYRCSCWYLVTGLTLKGFVIEYPDVS